jgi:hypothetical protein
MQWFAASENDCHPWSFGKLMVRIAHVTPANSTNTGISVTVDAQRRGKLERNADQYITIDSLLETCSLRSLAGTS